MSANTLHAGVSEIKWTAIALAGSATMFSPATRAGSPTPFTEEAVVRGIDYVPDECGFSFGCGVAFADLDGDGDPDVITLGKAGGVVGVFENDGTGYFVDRSATSGIPLLTAASGVVAGDYDADGDLDLYLSNWMVADMLLRNDGDFLFQDVTGSAGLGDAGPGTGCAWGDYDNDGWLDLYVSNRTPPDTPSQVNRLYRNLGDGTFADVAADLEVDDDRMTFQAVFFDMDRDGDADLYLSNDRGNVPGCTVHNRLFENVGGSFADITVSSGTAACFDSMGVAVGDFDGDGAQDLYCTNTPGGNALFLNQGDGVFADATQSAGVASYAFGWGALFGDFGNGGFQDLYVCNLAAATNRLYRHGGQFPTVDVAGIMDVDDAGPSYATAEADVDGDGDLDLMVQNNWYRVHLYINHEGELHDWIRFNVAGRGANRFAIGAVVDVRVGGTRRVREVIAGSNFKSQNELTVHFGLGDAAMVDEVTIMWPGGLTRSVSHLVTHQTWTLYPPEQLGDGNHDGSVDLTDYGVFVACHTGPLPGLLVPGCEMMDVDGDGDVDVLDFGRFQALLHGGP